MKRDDVKKFVRETLGCRCPEDVFRYVEVESNVRLTEDIVLNRRINVGNRLLIYIVDGSDEFVKDNLLTLVDYGKKERDTKGFNRFRLVIITDKAWERNQKLDLMEKDERVHIHLVERNGVPL
jgi:hypothetical protein